MILLLCLLPVADAFGGKVTPGQVETVMMNAMNTLKDNNLNPGIGWGLADIVNVQLTQQDVADAGCIIPTPGGGKCICHASATYTVYFPSLTKVSTLKLSTWKQVTANNDTNPGEFQMSIEGTLVGTDMPADGTSAAEASACGIKPRAHGTASTKVSVNAPVVITMVGQLPNATANCLNVVASDVLITFNNVTLSGTNVVIKTVPPLPPIPADKYDHLVDLDVPGFTSKLQDGVTPSITNVILDTINNRLPKCIPLSGPIPPPSPQPHPAPPPSPPASCFPVGCGPSYLKKSQIKDHCCSGKGIYHPGCRGSHYRCCKESGC